MYGTAGGRAAQWMLLAEGFSLCLLGRFLAWPCTRQVGLCTEVLAHPDVLPSLLIGDMPYVATTASGTDTAWSINLGPHTSAMTTAIGGRLVHPERSCVMPRLNSLFFFRLDLHSRFPYYAWQPSHTTGSVAMARRRRRGAALTGGGCIGRPPPPCFPPGETCARTGARRQTRKREKSVPRTCPRRRASHLDFLPATQRSHDCTQPHCKPKRR